MSSIIISALSGFLNIKNSQAVFENALDETALFSVAFDSAGAGLVASGLAASEHSHTLASLGAAASGHTHTIESLGAAASVHGHYYDDLLNHGLRSYVLSFSGNGDNSLFLSLPFTPVCGLIVSTPNPSSSGFLIAYPTLTQIYLFSGGYIDSVFAAEPLGVTFNSVLNVIGQYYLALMFG